MKAVFIYSVDSRGMEDIPRTSVFVYDNYEHPTVHHDLSQRTVTIYENGEIQTVITGVVMWRRDNDYSPSNTVSSLDSTETAE